MPSTENSNASTQPDELSWETWMPAARERLTQRVANLRPGTAADALSTSVTRLPSKKHCLQNSSAAQPNSLERTQTNKRTRANERLRFDGAVGGASTPEPKNSNQRQQIAQWLAESSEEHLAQKQESEAHSKQNRIRGAVASAVAHVALIGVLAFITLKAPQETAGMSFAAASVQPQEEVVELEQPLEVDPEPSEVSEQLEHAMDISQQFSEISPSTPLTDALGEMSPASESLASTSALSATQVTLPDASSASFFGAAAGGNNFCYVIDGSGSMRGGPWTAARTELLKSLASLTPKQRFYIIIFSRSLQVLPQPGSRDPAPSALYATRENIDHASRWLMGVKIGNSGGPPKKALELAIEKEPDAIYLLTDGVTSVKDVAETIREKNMVSDLILGDHIRVPIHAIAYYSLDGQQLLRRIAAENGGQFIYVPDPSGK